MLEKKTSIAFRINSFQNQNIYESNFNLIIKDSRLFNNNIKMGSYLDQAQVIML